MAGSSDVNTNMVDDLKMVTGSDKPNEYLKPWYSQVIVDNRKFSEEIGKQTETVETRMGRFRALLQDMQRAGDRGLEYSKLAQDVEELSAMFFDLKHWMKKADMGVEEKRRLLGYDD